MDAVAPPLDHDGTPLAVGDRVLRVSEGSGDGDDVRDDYPICIGDTFTVENTDVAIFPGNPHIYVAGVDAWFRAANFRKVVKPAEPEPQARPGRPLPRLESPDGQEYIYRDDDMVMCFNARCNPKIAASGDQDWQQVVYDHIAIAGWRYIGPVNDPDCDDTDVSVAEQQAEVELATITPSNDPRLSYISNVIHNTDYQYRVDVRGGGYWVVYDPSTLKEYATSHTDPDPVTAIRRLTAKPEPEPKPVDPMQELLEAASEFRETTVWRVGDKGRTPAEVSAISSRMDAALAAAREALEAKS